MKSFTFINDVPTYVKTKHEDSICYLDEYLFVSVKSLRDIQGDIPSEIFLKLFGWKKEEIRSGINNPLRTFFAKFYESGLLTRSNSYNVDLYIDSPTIASFKKKHGLKVFPSDYHIHVGVPFVQLYLHHRDLLDKFMKTHGIDSYEALYRRLTFKVLSVKTDNY